MIMIVARKVSSAIPVVTPRLMVRVSPGSTPTVNVAVFVPAGMSQPRIRVDQKYPLKILSRRARSSAPVTMIVLTPSGSFT